MNSNRTLCLILLGITISGFILLEAPNIYQAETFPDYTDNVKPFLDNCSIDHFPIKRDGLKWYSICISDKIFGTPRLVPLMFSTAIIPLVYLFISELTQKRILGLLGSLILVSSGAFNIFASTSTYPPIDVFFFVMFLYLCLKGKVYAPLFYVLAILSKPLPIVYFPLVLYFVYSLNIPKEKKKTILVFLTVIVIIGISLVIFNEFSKEKLPLISIGGSIRFDQTQFMEGFYEWFELLDSDIIVAVTVVIVLIQLFKLSKNQVYLSKPIFFFILGMILTVPIIQGFTDQLNHSYRFIPLVIMVSSGIGICLSNWLEKYERVTLN
jgi:hypothetical protein